jgi:hypothetical protein
VASELEVFAKCEVFAWERMYWICVSPGLEASASLLEAEGRRMQDLDERAGARLGMLVAVSLRWPASGERKGLCEREMWYCRAC